MRVSVPKCVGDASVLTTSASAFGCLLPPMCVHINKCAEGRVNKVCSEYIGLVVMGTFNASIRRDEIPEDFRFLEEQASKGPSSSFLGRSSWTSRSKEWHSISTGTDVVFVVDGYAVMPPPPRAKYI